MIDRSKWATTEILRRSKEKRARKKTEQAATSLLRLYDACAHRLSADRRERASVRPRCASYREWWFRPYRKCVRTHPPGEPRLPWRSRSVPGSCPPTGRASRRSLANHRRLTCPTFPLSCRRLASIFLQLDPNSWNLLGSWVLPTPSEDHRWSAWEIQQITDNGLHN